MLGCLLEAEFVADCEKERATYNSQLATYKYTAGNIQHATRNIQVYSRQHTTHVRIAQKQQFLRDCKKKGEKATAEEKKALKLAVLGYPRWLEYRHVLEYPSVLHPALEQHRVEEYASTYKCRPHAKPQRRAYVAPLKRMAGKESSTVTTDSALTASDRDG